jgi:hypothetical protein
MAHHIRERFPDKTHTINLLMAEDPEFFTLCEDHDACVDALWYWAKSEAPEAETRVNEYRTLVRELREEITQVLAALEPRRAD